MGRISSHIHHIHPCKQTWNLTKGPSKKGQSSINHAFLVFHLSVWGSVYSLKQKHGCQLVTAHMSFFIEKNDGTIKMVPSKNLPHITPYITWVFKMGISSGISSPYVKKDSNKGGVKQTAQGHGTHHSKGGPVFPALFWSRLLNI